MRYTLPHDFKKSVVRIIPRCVHLIGNQQLLVSFLNQVIGPLPVSIALAVCCFTHLFKLTTTVSAIK